MKPFPFLMSLEASNICSVWVSAVFLVELFLLGSPSLLSLEFCIKEILQGLQPQQRPGLGTRGTRLGVRTSPTKAGDSEDVNHPAPAVISTLLQASLCLSPSPEFTIPMYQDSFPEDVFLSLHIFHCLVITCLRVLPPQQTGSSFQDLSPTHLWISGIWYVVGDQQMIK